MYIIYFHFAICFRDCQEKTLYDSFFKEVMNPEYAPENQVPKN